MNENIAEMSLSKKRGKLTLPPLKQWASSSESSVKLEYLMKDKALMEKMDISRTTFHRMRKEGLPFYKIGGSIRYDEKKVKKWIKSVWNLNYIKKKDPNKITNDELMGMLSISRTTLHRLREEGMPYVKIGNRVAYDLEEVERWLGIRTPSQNNDKDM